MDLESTFRILLGALFFVPALILIPLFLYVGLLSVIEGSGLLDFFLRKGGDAAEQDRSDEQDKDMHEAA